MKTCKRCLLSKPLSAFRPDPRYRDGAGSWCAECHRVRNSEWARANRAKLTAKGAAWRAANRDKAREINMAYKRRNPDSWANYMATRRGAMPAWANEAAMRAIYLRARRLSRETGQPYHVDHIVPLRHQLVCGLHWEGNMQPLRAVINIRKKNHYWPDMPRPVAERIDNAYRQERLFA